MSLYIVLGILDWVATPAYGQTDLLPLMGLVATLGWSVLAYQLLRHWALSEQRLQTTFEQAMAGIGVIDGRAHWIDVNERLAQLTGYTVAELRGQPLCALLMPEELETFCGRVQAFLDDAQGPGEYSVESRWRRKDGTAVWLSRHIRRVPPVRGTPARAMMVVFDISDRKTAELREHEQQSLEAFQFLHSPMALIEWDDRMRVRRWSHQAETMFGWSNAEMVGRTLREVGFLSPAEADHHEGVMREFACGQRDTVESLRQVRCKDGRLVWCRWYSRALRNEDGSLRYFFTAGMDVTELRHALESVQEKESQLRAIFDQATVGVALLDEQGRWLSVNQRLCEITGYPMDELLKLDFQTITHPEDLDVDVELARQVANGDRNSYVLDKRYIHKLGHTVWIRLHVGRIAATAVLHMRYVSVIEDISEQKRVEQEAAEHRRIRDLHVENSPLAVIEWTPDLRVASWSRRAEQMFGWAAEEVIGRHPDEFGLVHELDQSLLGRWREQVDADRPTFTSIINRNVHKDGRTVWCHWYNSMLYAADGSLRSVYCMVDDVTEQQSALENLRESQAQFRSVFEQAAVGIAIVDAESRWLMVNRRFCEITGYLPEQLEGRTCQGITDPEDSPGERALRQRLMAGDISDYRYEKRYVKPDGGVAWVSLFARRLDQAPGLPVRLALVVDDIAERRESARQLQRLHADLENKVAQRTEQLQETTRRWADRSRDLSVLSEMMSALPAAKNTHEANRIIASFLPQVFRQCSGEVWIEEGESGRFVHLGAWSLPRPGPLAVGVDDCWSLRRNQALRVEDPRDPLVCPHTHDSPGSQGPHSCTPIVALGETIGLIHLRWDRQADHTPDQALVDSTAEQIGLAVGNVRLREELRQQALRDPLTGLFNRRHFEDVVRRRLADRRSSQGFGLLLIDIDHFKSINDRHGHDAGDEVLRVVSRVLQQSARSDDAVFRLGGEEFVVLCDDADSTTLRGAAERLRHQIERQAISFQGMQLPGVTASIGGAHFPTDAGNADTLLKRADQAMYEAKRTGRNCACFAGLQPDFPAKLAAVAGAGGQRPQ